MATYLIAALCLIASTLAFPHPRDANCIKYPFPFVTRNQWGAEAPKSTTPLNTPAPYVVIHHTYEPGVCMTRDLCMRYMRSMQDFHQNTNGWVDIGYNFAVGGEGSVFEGRGWQILGAHAAGFNSLSIGIVFIGDFVSSLPPPKSLDTAKRLIATGVELGYISPDYKLVGHRQVTATECPGSALFELIQTWEHFSPTL